MNGAFRKFFRQKMNKNKLKCYFLFVCHEGSIDGLTEYSRKFGMGIVFNSGPVCVGWSLSGYDDVRSWLWRGRTSNSKFGYAGC